MTSSTRCRDARAATCPGPADSAVLTAVEGIPLQATRDHRADATLAAAHREIATLRAGLQRRTVIGQAVGITMIRTGTTEDAAFAQLVELSQDTNVKVRDLAQRIVDAANDHATVAEGTDRSLPLRSRDQARGSFRTS